MRRPVLFCLMLLLLAPVAAQGGRRTEIRLNVPVPLTAGKDRQVIVLGQITDHRRFEDRPAEASTPSIAEGGVAGISSGQRRYYIGRVRDNFGKARNNVFLSHDQPVEEVVRELLTKSLAAQGYRVVSESAAGDTQALTMDVDIDQLWGYIEIGVGGLGGVAPAMAGRIKTVLKVRGPGGEKNYEVNGSALHRFMKMTPEHWVQMFEELFLDYQGNLARVRF